MPYVLDTSVAIALRDGDPEILARMTEIQEPVLISIVTRVELEGGVYREPSEAGIRRARLDAILQSIPSLPFDDAAADAYRFIVEAAGYSRRKLLDRMIAAQARVHLATLVTRNAADFRDCPGLPVVEW